MRCCWGCPRSTRRSRRSAAEAHEAPARAGLGVRGPPELDSPIVSTPSPYVVNVHDLVHRPGEMRERELDFAVPEKLGEGAASVAEGERLRIDLRLEGLHDGVLATGDVDTLA